MKGSKIKSNSGPTLKKHMSQPTKFIFSSFCLASSIVSLAFTLPSQAASVTYSSDTTGKPTFNRPQAPGFEGTTDNPPTALSSNGTAVPYFSQPFFVSSTGVYDIAGTQNFDGVEFLYQKSFNPTSPLTNLLSANDSFPDVGNSSIYNFPLIAGSQYFIVTSGFSNSDFGTFTNTISGPISGTGPSPNLGTVPEPSSVLSTVAFGIAGGSLMLKRQLKKQLVAATMK